MKRTYQFRVDKEDGLKIVVHPCEFKGQWHYILEGGSGAILVYGLNNARRIADALNRDRKATLAA